MHTGSTSRVRTYRLCTVPVPLFIVCLSPRYREWYYGTDVLAEHVSTVYVLYLYRYLLSVSLFGTGSGTTVPIVSCYGTVAHTGGTGTLAEYVGTSTVYVLYLYRYCNAREYR